MNGDKLWASTPTARFVHTVKVAVAQAMSLTGISRALFGMQRKALRGNYIRAINYHDTPADTALNFETQLQFYQHYFSPVSFTDLDSFFITGAWTKDKPGLIISFDDAFKSNYDVAAPLLEKYGFTGWFFVPSTFIYNPGVEVVKTYRGRPTMSWDEIKQLDRKHLIGCHTKTHYRLVASTSREKLDEEIVEAKHDLEEKLQHKVDVFCWVGGERHTYSSAAAKRVEEAGYTYAFMASSAPIRPGTQRFQLQRTNVESDWPVELVKLQLSGLWDLIYVPKRIWINRIVRTEKRSSL